MLLENTQAHPHTYNRAKITTGKCVRFLLPSQNIATNKEFIKLSWGFKFKQ